eukprot:TRINITY_DN8495_c0_g2_i2.p1 TRINITY_DN8495_c0_g2~~TRINITY_DN8495_c0_g2_i2.p1  ORF type:complete len:118 (+),score=8.89 TRINITY_DN8495_c0_g2_i2:72-425(+)
MDFVHNYTENDDHLLFTVVVNSKKRHTTGDLVLLEKDSTLQLVLDDKTIDMNPVSSCSSCTRWEVHVHLPLTHLGGHISHHCLPYYFQTNIPSRFPYHGRRIPSNGSFYTKCSMIFT